MSTDNKPVKKYRLLKDLPDAKAGGIYVKRYANGDTYVNEYTLTQKSPVIEHNTYFAWQVENNLEWFSPIEEELPLTKENISISDVFLNAPDKYNRNVYSFRTSSLLLQEKLPVIKQAIKNALNDCPPQPAEQVLNSNNEGEFPENKPTDTVKEDKVDGKEGRDWEILSVLADDGNPIYYPSRDIIDACLKRNGERIHSVKRNSDQITFTVGDIIEGAQLEAHNTVSHHPTEIKSIRVINGTIGLAYGNGGEVIISHAKKLPESQPKEQVPLFTTEDGVKVMEWDTFYYVPESMEWVNSCCRAMPQPPESFKYFSTKEAAEQYILENKPCLSLNDVKLISNIHGVTEKTQWYEVPLYALKHTIKQIINQ